MDAGGKNAPAARVVVLTRDPGFALDGRGADAAPSLELVGAGSAIEAAAEILAAPASALVIDLRAVGSRPARLLQIARRMGVAALAWGPVPTALSSDDLDGVLLVSRTELPQALARLAAEPPEPAQPVRLTPAKRPKDARQQARPAPPQSPPAPGAGALLSPDELSALLEDET